MIKLVASDLDGTLLHNYQQTVPKEIYDTIKALHEKGIIFTAASGRQYANIRRLFAPLGFDIPYIAENEKGRQCRAEKRKNKCENLRKRISRR